MSTRHFFLNLDGSRRGGPHVWSRRFSQLLEHRGFEITHGLRSDWQTGLFVVHTDGMEEALQLGRTIGYRVAGGYLPQWFQVTGRTMRPEHHATNANIAQALASASAVIYQSHWAKKQLDELLYERSDDYAIIYNGVELQKFRPRSERLSEPPVLGTVGVLRYRYRLETFLEMSRRLEIPHRLLIIGSLDEECSQVLHQYQADSQVGPRITYQPHVPFDELPYWYQQMSLLVHPVSGDVCPNVVAEALACGVPVVAPRHGGTAELVGKAGVIFENQPWFYDETFINAMTSAAVQALEGSAALSLLARRQAEAQLDAQQMVNKYLELLGLPKEVPNSQSRTQPANWKQSLRQLGSQWIARPRFYAALSLRKARQTYRRTFPAPTNPRPRIAFTLYDFHVGGIENWLYRLAGELNQEFDFYFLATRVSKFLPKFLQVGTFSYLPSPAQMTLYLQKHNIDIVQVHNERWPVDAALAAGVSHVIERLGGQRSWRRVPKYGIERVIASAQMAAEAVADLLPADRIHLIYNGIDLDAVDAAHPQRLFQDNTLVVGRTSRFGRGQNLNLLIEALGQLQHRCPELRLVLVGGDSQLPTAERVEPLLRRRVQELALDEKVQFTGMVEDTLPLVQGFDIGTCVSNSEGIPNSLIEMMACRKPVIATRVGAIHELVQDGINGLLIPAGSLDALIEAIERLAADPGLRLRLGAAGRRMIKERFSLQAAARQYAQVYYDLLGR